MNPSMNPKYLRGTDAQRDHVRCYIRDWTNINVFDLKFALEAHINLGRLAVRRGINTLKKEEA